MPLRDILSGLPSKVALDALDLAVHKTGGVRWSIALQSCAIDYEKAGPITRDRGVWSITPDGAASLSRPAADAFARGRKAYSAWKASQGSGDPANTDGQSSVGAAAATQAPATAEADRIEEEARSALARVVGPQCLRVPSFRRRRPARPWLLRGPDLSEGTGRRHGHPGLSRPAWRADAARSGAGEASPVAEGDQRGTRLLARYPAARARDRFLRVVRGLHQRCRCRGKPRPPAHPADGPRPGLGRVCRELRATASRRPRSVATASSLRSRSGRGVTRVARHTSTVALLA